MDDLIFLTLDSAKVIQEGNFVSFPLIASVSDVPLEGHGMVFKVGAFKSAIKKLKTDGIEKVPLLYNHDSNNIIGGLPVSSIFERKGVLTMTAELNLALSQARDVFELLKQKVLKEVSVGVVLDPGEVEYDDDTKLLNIEGVKQIREASIVFDAANSQARVSGFKATSFTDLPLADNTKPWDKASAVKRVRAFTDSEDSPTSRYKRSFFWFDSENSDNFTAYKLPFADVVGGRLVAVPRAISAVVGALKGARGGVNIPESDRAGVERHVNRYLVKMGKDKAFAQKEINEYDIRDCERFLRDNGLSTLASKTFISKIKESIQMSTVDDDDTHITRDDVSDRDALLNVKDNLRLARILQHKH